ncbi:hypothetical protein [Methyloversatilis sp. MC4-4]|uniref:hypothetical protein n=1 Tax=Methyloversatilis sp. MC4-4 TaxID=3132824 RepID=UPI003CF2CCEA
MGKITLDLPGSFKSLKLKNLESILKEELYSQRRRLPLDDFIREGGWPDDDTLHTTLKSVDDNGAVTTVEVQLSFDEVCSTGCSDIERRGSGWGLLFIYFDHKTGVAHCEEQ